MHPELRPKEIAEAIDNLERIVTLFRGRRSPLTRRAATVLDALARRDAETPTDLARVLAIRPSTLSEVLTRLEKRRLIARTRSADDGRRIRIELTLEGERVRRLPVRFDAEGVSQGFREFSPDQFVALRRCMRVLARKQTPAGVPITS